MVRARLRTLPGRLRLRQLAAGLWAAGAPLLGVGCAQAAGYNDGGAAVLSRGVSAGAPAPAASGGVVGAAPVPGGEPTAQAHEVPISLDTVLRLAEESNPRIALARERVNESLLENTVAAGSWLPNIYAGIAYYRHEGGVQNEDGTLTHSSTGALFPGLQIQTEFDLREATFQRVNAERGVWQQKGELSRVTNEVLLEAATTYIDLLTARRGEAVARELQKFEERLLRRAEALRRDEPGAAVLVAAIRTALSGRRQALAGLSQQGDAASAKLAYLLGLGPHARLVPVDLTLTPVDLVDVSPPVDELVARALAEGPGVRELEGLLAVIQGGIEQASSGLARFLPTLQVNAFEGAFGAGPGASLSWDNRLDIGLQARWNLTALATARERQKIAQSKLQQVRLTYQDLRGRLALGVQEARSAIVTGREQMARGTEQIRNASETYRLSNLRLEQNAPGATTAEVQQSIRGLEAAHTGYIQAISAYNKAQIRLLLLLGPGAACKPVASLPPATDVPGVLLPGADATDSPRRRSQGSDATDSSRKR